MFMFIFVFAGLLLQMLSRRKVTTMSDILHRTLGPIVDILTGLQPVERAGGTIDWWARFQTNCLQNVIHIVHEPSNEDISRIEEENKFYTVIYNIPAFFEFVSASLDELRRDVSINTFHLMYSCKCILHVSCDSI